MRRQTHQRLVTAAQITAILSIIGWVIGNVITVMTIPQSEEVTFNGWLLLMPFGALVGWGLALGAPYLWRLAPRPEARVFRLVYSGSSDWSDEVARKALLHLAQRIGGMGITWARDGAGVGCWLSVRRDEAVLMRLVAETFPEGNLEPDRLPLRAGQVLLKLKKPLASPYALFEVCPEGLEGVYTYWHNEDSATVAVWGPAAGEIAETYTHPGDRAPGSEQELRHPLYTGHNPWPQLPVFPSSVGNSALAAVSPISRLAPLLRLDQGAGQTSLKLGSDDTGALVGFPLAGFKDAQTVQIVGDEAATVTGNLICQAVAAKQPVFLIDGEGSVAAQISRRLNREIALGEVLDCDLSRPAQSRFRLNPFYLPEDKTLWPQTVRLWRRYLRDLGVTLGGLGQVAYRHTLVAVTLTALAAWARELEMDPTGLLDALEQPNFLTRLDEIGWEEKLLGTDIWHWWQAEGRFAPAFDVQGRLGHLRQRLAGLLQLPEYRVLWRAPYLSPEEPLRASQSLIWRFSAGRRRLHPFAQGQLLALTNMLLTQRAAPQPTLVVFHGYHPVQWVESIRQVPSARLLLAGHSATDLPALPTEATTRIISRLGREDAQQIQVPDVRPSDLRRLPVGRLIVQQGHQVSTVTLEAA